MATGVYWVGQDGNTYMKADTLNGVVKWVAPYQTPQQMGLTEIADPLAPPSPTNTTTNANVSTPAKSVNMAAVGATQQAIDSLGTELDTGYRNIDDSYNALMSGYEQDKARTEGDYQENTTTNNQNLEKNTQNAYVAAAQGRRGLRGTLSAIGALGGTGGELADRAVTEEANKDIGGARDTATTNAGKLDKAIGRYREEDDQRRREAATARENQRRSTEGSVASKKQSFYQKMADLYSEGGNTAKANEYLAMAGGLNNEIAAKTAVGATPFVSKAAAFTPGSLESYLAGANDMTVKVAEGANGQPNTLIAGNPNDPTKKRKDREDAVAAAAAA